MYITSCHYFYLLLIIFFSPSLFLLISLSVRRLRDEQQKEKKEAFDRNKDLSMTVSFYCSTLSSTVHIESIE